MRRFPVLVAALAVVASGCARPATPAATGEFVRPPAAPVVSLAPSAPPAPPSPSPRASTPKPSPSTRKPTPKPKPKPQPLLAATLHTVPASTTQLVIVHAPVAGTTYATLETFNKVGGVWQRAFPPMAARIGSDGFSDHPAEYVPHTPIGMFGFGPTMYGVDPDPGVHYPYHVLVSGDWWNENPSSPEYNTFQHGSDPGGASEALWEGTVGYQYFAFITFNVDPTVPGGGSAVFLHVDIGGPTAGCVSVSKSHLVEVLRWLDPKRNPRIVLSPDGDLHRY